MGVRASCRRPVRLTPGRIFGGQVTAPLSCNLSTRFVRCGPSGICGVRDGAPETRVFSGLNGGPADPNKSTPDPWEAIATGYRNLRWATHVQPEGYTFTYRSHFFALRACHRRAKERCDGGTTVTAESVLLGRRSGTAEGSFGVSAQCTGRGP